MYKKDVNEYISKYRDGSSNNLTVCVYAIKCNNAYALYNNKEV